MSGNQPETLGADGFLNDDVSSYPAAHQTPMQWQQPVQTKAMLFHKPFSRSILPWAFAPIFFITGCHAMNNPPPTATDRIEPPALTKEVPLRFKRHNFDAYCFNTIGCTVIYNGRYQVEDAPDKVSPPPPPSPDYAQKWMGGEADIRNFPPSAEVRWKSLDGVVHEAKVDIGAIFRDELIWHKVPKSDMPSYPKGWSGVGDPDIFLEVNNRTINVYIGALVPTLTEQRPGHKDSNYRKDNLLAWTHTY